MNLEHSYTTTLPTLCVPATPDIPTGTRLAWLNQPLAQDLGLNPDDLHTPEGLAHLTGAHHPSYALAYSGHQFGTFSPVLGDGRAHLIGEITGPSGARTNIHLKGSGRTPYSRPGSDGKAPLAAVWREAIIGEALTALGVPASRALGILETGEHIRRRAPQPEPAGILIRTAASHLRVGTFQYAQLTGDTTARTNLITYALNRHYPGTATGNTAHDAHTLLHKVAHAQAHLLAQWMSLGFVHGVLNTDNVSISGQAIDFGPCAFIDGFTRGAVYSSIDLQGRYAYRNQPAITQWNLARFSESLLDLLNPDDPNQAIHLATSVLDYFEETYRDTHTRLFAAKLGIDLTEAGEDHWEATAGFIDRTLTLMEDYRADFTRFFRALTDHSSHSRAAVLAALHQVGSPAASAPSIDTWLADLDALRVATGTSPETSTALMAGANPIYIPRNLHLEAALTAATAGDTGPILRLLDAVSNPYTRRPDYRDLEETPTSDGPFTSYCGT